MKFILILFLASLAIQQNETRQLFINARDMDPTPSSVGTPGDECGSCKTEWFEQTLDHFDSTDNRTWKQKFFSNDEFFDWTTKTGPVFLIVGGESPIAMGRMSGFHWHGMAEQTGALLLQLEHRYYGESWPLGADSLTTENLKYLSSQQALEDLANFIKTLNAQHEFPEDIKWVTWGGSYSGNLAAWSRKNYPDLVFAAVASSAPVSPKVDYPEYFQVVHEAIKGHSEGCANAIKNAIDTTAVYLGIEGGADILNSYYNLCTPLSENTPARDITTLYLYFAQVLSTVVQDNFETALPQTSQIMNDICTTMLNTSIGDTVQRFNRTASRLGCIFYSYDGSVYYWKQTDINDTMAGQRSWMYQTCTEFGNFMTTSSFPLFPDVVDADYSIGQCRDVFGEEFNSESVYAAVEATLTRYGGRDTTTDRTIWVQGSFDPWYPLGVTESDNPNSPAYLIERTSHCQDQFSNVWYDLPQMIETRNSIEKTLLDWLDV